MIQFKLVFMVLLALVVCGCERQEQLAPTTATAPSLVSQEELENVARCFFVSVELLQSTPDHPRDYAQFVALGKRAAAKSNRTLTNANFDSLIWSQDGSALLTTGNERIECRVVNQEHDHFGREGTAWVIEYEFFITGTNASSQATIQLHMK